MKLVEIETREQLRRLSANTAMMLHQLPNDAGQIKVDEWPKLAKQYNLPCLNDTAADLLPSHICGITVMGYDLVTFSGGKAIRGPQCAGLLMDGLILSYLLNMVTRYDWPGQKVARKKLLG